MNLEHVDLGLPSGTLWAKCNLGAEKESDFGLYYQWGDTQGYSGVDEHQFNWSDYKLRMSGNLTKYSENDTKLILENEDDPIFVATKGKLKTPTKELLQELIDHTNHEWTTIDAVEGMKFINKKDDTKYIFIPAAGGCSNGSHIAVGSWGNVWSASRDESYVNYAWGMGFVADAVGVDYHNNRCIGYSVRGVTVPQAETFDEIDDTDDGQPVDLGLPSGTLWAKCNLGAKKETDFGLYYQWGDVEGHSLTDGYDVSWGTYKYKFIPTKYSVVDDLIALQNEDDAVFVATEGQMIIPTKYQLEELVANTNHEWTSINGVNGMKFSNKNDSDKYIFIPAGGCRLNEETDGISKWGVLWSACRHMECDAAAENFSFNSKDMIVLFNFRDLGCNLRGVVNHK